MQLVFSDGAILGRREEQQDDKTNLRLRNGYHLCVLADGMGGAAGGRTASKIVCTAFRRYFSELQSFQEAQTPLLRALMEANRQIGEAVRQKPQLAGMGATVIALLLHVASGRFNFLSVGDSPLYQFRKGVLLRLNDNHAYYENLKMQVARGMISRASAEADPSRHDVTSVVMGTDIPLVDQKDGLLLPGEWLLMASDGIQTLDDSAAGTVAHLIAAAGKDPENTVLGVLRAVEAAADPQQDNTTLILLGLEEAPGEAEFSANPAMCGPQATIRADIAAAPPKRRGILIPVLIVVFLLGLAGGLYFFLRGEELPAPQAELPAQTPPVSPEADDGQGDPESGSDDRDGSADTGISSDELEAILKEESEAQGARDPVPGGTGPLSPNEKGASSGAAQKGTGTGQAGQGAASGKKKGGKAAGRQRGAAG
jgi:serine/threonine protein phosphatase PrpC